MNGEQDPSSNAKQQADQDAAREAMDRLNKQNRILVEARMLSPHVMLTEEQARPIVEHFKAYIEKHGVKAAQVAREIQYSPAVLSAWMGGTYRGSVEGVTIAINNWMERDARRRQSRRPKDYVRTWVAEDIRTYVYLADKHGSMAVIVAPAGTGKTLVIKTLAEELRGLYICCTEGLTLRGLYVTLATALGWTRVHSPTSDLVRYIIEQLNGTRRIIFIDEAHLMGPAIRSLRTIYDQAQTPIVFVGTDEIEQATDDRSHGRGQFSSRCVYYNAMDHAYNAEGPDGTSDAKDLFTVEEVREFYSRRKIRLDREGFKMMWALACLPGYGCLRLIERITEVAVTINPDAECLTRDDLLGALRMVESRRFVLLQRLANRQAERCVEPAAAKAAG